MLALAGELIDRKSGDFDPSNFRSKYAQALRDLVGEQRKKGHIAAPGEDEVQPESAKVIDLMAALQKSVAGGQKRKAGRAKSASRKKKKRSASRKSRASG